MRVDRAEEAGLHDPLAAPGAGGAPRRIGILTVSHNTGELIRFQQQLTSRLCSANSQLTWHVLDTSPHTLDEELLRRTPGVVLHESDIRDRYRPDRCPPDVSPRSFQHAMALNFLLRRADEEDLLILDPDCLILRQNWDEVLVAAREGRSQVMVGAPYHPCRRYKHGLNRPTVTLMFASRGPLMALNPDFSPGLYPDLSSVMFKSPLLRPVKYGSWKDTGWAVVEEARKRGWKLISFDAPLLRPGLEPRGLGRLLRPLIPARLLFLPKRPYQRPESGLVGEEVLASAPGGELYEEYYFQERLFACHLRGISQRGVGFQEPALQFWLERAEAYVAEFSQTTS